MAPCPSAGTRVVLPHYNRNKRVGRFLPDFGWLNYALSSDWGNPQQRWFANLTSTWPVDPGIKQRDIREHRCLLVQLRTDIFVVQSNRHTHLVFGPVGSRVAPYGCHAP